MSNMEKVFLENTLDNVNKMIDNAKSAQELAYAMGYSVGLLKGLKVSRVLEYEDYKTLYDEVKRKIDKAGEKYEYCE